MLYCNCKNIAICSDIKIENRNPEVKIKCVLKALVLKTHILTVYTNHWDTLVLPCHDEQSEGGHHQEFFVSVVCVRRIEILMDID